MVENVRETNLSIPFLGERFTLELPFERDALSPSWITYGILVIPREHRPKFPGYKVPFIFQTNIGDLIVKVSSAPWNTPIGDSDAGAYITGMGEYWRRHSELQPGSELGIIRRSELVYLLETDRT